MGVFEFVKTINISVVLTRRHIICYVHIPPGVVVVNAVPSVVGQRTVIGCAVNNITRDVLTTTEGSEEIGKIVTYAFMCA